MSSWRRAAIAEIVLVSATLATSGVAEFMRCVGSILMKKISGLFGFVIGISLSFVQAGDPPPP